MSKTTMLRAVELNLPVIHSVDYYRLHKEGRASFNGDGTSTVCGKRVVVSDEAWTKVFEDE